MPIGRTGILLWSVWSSARNVEASTTFLAITFHRDRFSWLRRVTQPATKKPRRPGRGKGMGKQNYRVRYTRRDDSRLNRRHVSLTK